MMRDVDGRCHGGSCVDEIESGRFLVDPTRMGGFDRQRDRRTNSAPAAGTHGFKFKGKGALLPFGTELPTDELVVQVVSDDGVTRRCRQAFLTTSSSSTTGYRGAFKP